MQNKTRAIVPSRLETWGVAFFSLVFVLLGSAHDLLQRYGLISSSHVVHDQLSKGVGQGLQKLDSYSFTQNATTFVVWGLVGLVSFSIFQTVWRASQRLKYEQEVSSNEYIHPANFNRQNYWRTIVVDLGLSLVFTALLLVSLGFYALRALPYATHHVGRFLLQLNLGNLKDLALGLVVGFASTYVLYVVWKISVWHHRASQQ